MPIDSTKSQGDEFERKVKSLLELHGFHVERNRYTAGRQTDLIAEKEVYPAKLSFLVECKDYRSPVKMKVVTDMHARVDGVRRTENADARGWIVAAGEFAMNAREHADALGITCSTYAKIERELIDFGAYLHALIRAYESEGVERGSSITKLWVEPEVIENKTGQQMPLNELAREWLADPESNHLTLLGDYGTGKTWFTIKWASELAQAHLDDPMAIVPVRIELKEYSRVLDFQTMITNHISHYGIPAASFAAFEHLWRAGHILLILDGFDEMVTQVDAEVTRRNFDELNRALDGRPRARMLLTCRTHYFRDRPEVEKMFGRRDEFGGTELYQAIVGRPNYRIAFLQELDDPRIQQYLQKACGPSYEKDRQTIKNIYDLEDLARRPVLLDMVVKSLPQLRAEGEAGRRVTAADLYQVYTRFWTERDDWRMSLTREGKLAFAQELARRLWLEQRTSLHWGELREVTQEHFKERLSVSRELEYAEHEVRTASFLTRDAAGNYGFAHRSFLEFFVAQWLAPRLLDTSAPEMTINEEIRGFVHGLLAEAMEDWPLPPPEGVEVPEGMVWVPLGPFIYGEGQGTRVVRLEQGFFVARTPVTNGEYARFVAATGRRPPGYWEGQAPPDRLRNHPVAHVSWRDAVDYAEWVGVRLLTDQEWEKSARGIDGRIYPWGDEFDPARCNTSESGIGTTTPVRRYSPGGDSACGCADMAGNAWEWTASKWEAGGESRVLRGGAFDVGARGVRCAFRRWRYPSYHWGSYGFRVVASPVHL